MSKSDTSAKDQEQGDSVQVESFTPDSNILAALIHSLPLNIYAKDREGRFVLANTTYCRRVGIKLEDLIGKTDYDIHPGELAEKYLADDLKIMESGQTKSIEEKWQAIDGKDSYVQVVKAPLRDAPDTDRIIGTIGIFWDITERKRAEIALAEERNLLRTLIDNLPDYIYVKDLQSRFLIANHAVATVMGAKDPDDLLGKTDFDFFPKEQAQKFSADEQLVLHSSESIVDVEESLTDSEGRQRWVQTTKVPLRNIQGEVVGVVGVGHDVTNRKVAEQERQQLAIQLQQAQRMETLGTLTAGIAHDFNNLLSVINGYTEIMRMNTPGEHPHHETLSKVLTAGRSAATLVGQLLAFSRKQIAQVQVINLNDILTKTEALLQRVIGENVAITLKLAEELWAIKIDPAQLEQIIVNFAANARDAMPNGGDLLIGTSNVTLDEEYVAHHPGVTPGEYVLLTVSDNGMGMSPEIQKHIFEPFYTTKEKHQGTGLGMATVFGIVKQNKGHIWLYSEINQGTTFKVYLPRSHDESIGIVRQETFAEKEDCTGSETILIVEDEPVVQHLAQTILQGQGYQVRTASSGGEALRLVEEMAGPLHLILTDVIMPGMNGKVLAEEIVKKRPEVKVLFMSGYTGDAIGHYGILEPDVEFIQKPFSTGDLVRKVRSLLDA